MDIFLLLPYSPALVYDFLGKLIEMDRESFL